MHASANIGKDSDVFSFLWPERYCENNPEHRSNRDLIGDDEHVWTKDGIFNIEGGCYAKTIGLTEEKEPEVYRAIRFGSVLENVGLNPLSRDVDSMMFLEQRTRVFLTCWDTFYMQGSQQL